MNDKYVFVISLYVYPEYKNLFEDREVVISGRTENHCFNQEQWMVRDFFKKNGIAMRDVYKFVYPFGSFPISISIYNDIKNDK